MKLFKALSLVAALFVTTAVAFANTHEKCWDKDGKEITGAKDAEACKTAHGTWK